MDEEEIRSFKQTIRSTLDRTPDTEVIEWRSPSSGKTGKVKARFSYHSKGVLCRRAVFQLREGERKENHHFDICKTPSGWAVSEQPIRFDDSEKKALAQFMTQVLDKQESGVPISWSSDDSRVMVVLMPETENTPAGCREAAIDINGPEGAALQGQYRFCREEGKWRYRPSADGQGYP